MTEGKPNSPEATVAVVVTCEHGGNCIPEPYGPLFKNAATVLDSHRGWDPGAMQLADLFGTELNVPVYSATVSRLLVELNRSLDNPQLFSEFTDLVDSESKDKILQQHWYPYRTTVEKTISRLVEAGQRVLHLSVHSFTPIWNGTPRPTDVGLLFDPARSLEADFCQRWQVALCADVPLLTVHHNAPYSGTDDGFVTALRNQFSADRYVGLELEVNQKFLMPPQPETLALSQAIVTSFRNALAGW